MTEETGSWRSPWPPAGLSRTTLRVAAALRAEGPATRTRLRDVTGLSRPTVAAAITELDEQGLVASAEIDGGAPGQPPAQPLGQPIGQPPAQPPGQPLGRPAEVIQLSRRAGLVVGVDLGNRHVQLVLADLGHQQIDSMPRGEETYLHSPGVGTSPADAIGRVADLVRSLVKRNGASLREVVGVGFGIRAPVSRSGVVGSSTLLPAWTNVEPGPALSAELSGVPVRADNDASLGALGEWVFGMRGRREVTRDHELTYVKIGTGIGAGMVRNGRLHRGASGTAGELGHITLNHLERMPCSCGSHGCLEYYASGLKILERARTQRPDLDDLTDLVNRATEGDRFCRALIEDAGDLIGIGLGTLVNLNSPDDILIGGALSAAGDILLDPVRDKLRRTAMPPAVEAVRVGLAGLGRWSTTWGAAALALQNDDQSAG